MRDTAFPPYTYDDDLIQAARRDGKDRVRVYRLSDTVVVLGSGSRPDVELNLETCESDRVPVLRRRGGGCAVVLDPGNVIVSVVATGIPFGRNRRRFDLLTGWLADGLERIGVPGVTQAGICDLTVGDKKIGGACIHRSRDLLYYSVSLLIDPDLDRVARYLKHPPREPEYRRGRKHGEFMGSLSTLPRETGNGSATTSSSPDGNVGLITLTDPGTVATGLRRVLQPPDLLQN
jgi:lipoate-protein ligase A